MNARTRIEILAVPAFWLGVAIAVIVSGCQPAAGQSLDAALQTRVEQVVADERARADARHAETLARIDALEGRMDDVGARMEAMPAVAAVQPAVKLEPLRIREGGTAGNPRVYDGDDIGPVASISALGGVSHIVIRDFDLVKQGDGRQAGILVLGDWRGVSIIDCTVRGFDDGLNIQGAAAQGVVARDLVVDGCVIRDSRQSAGGHSQGMYLDSIDGVRITNTVLHNNGRRDSPFDHNLYGQFNVSGMVFAGNSTTLAAATGAMIRGGGDIADNIVAANPIGLIGGINATRITGNFVLGGAGFDSAPRDWGIGLWPSRGGLVEGNVVADVRADRSNGWAINAEVSTDRDGNIRGDSGFPDHYTQLGDDAGPTVIRGNRVHDWPSNPGHGPTIREHRLHRNVTIGANLVTDQPFGLSVEGFAASVGQPATLDGYVDYIAANPRVRIPEALAWLRASDSGPAVTVPTPVTVVPAAPAAPAATTVELLGEWGRWQGMPLVIRLHGRGGGDGWRADAVARSADGRTLIAQRSFDADQLTVWMADPSDATAWLDQDLMLATIREIERVAGTERRVIHGISMGGGGAFRLARLAHAAGMTFDAVRMDTPALLHSGHADHYANTDHGTGKAGNERAGDIDPDGLDFDPGAFRSVYLTVGGRDGVVSPQSARELRDVMEARGVNVTYWEDPAGGHEAWRDAPAWFTDGWIAAIRGP